MYKGIVDPNSHTKASGVVNGPPVMAISVPPRSGPACGEMASILIGWVRKNCRLFTEKSAPFVVTSRLVIPGDV